MVLLLTGLFAYRAARLLVRDELVQAYANAERLIGWERRLKLLNEVDVQGWFVGNELAIWLVNHYYFYAHFVGTLICVVWIYVFRPAHYGRIRRVLFATTGCALAIHIAFPLAPPRWFSDRGFVDTLQTFGPRIYDSETIANTANQIAAMPSLHVGWAVIGAWAIIRAGSHPLRWLALLHPMGMTATVIITANHWWLDAIVAFGVVGIITLLDTPIQRHLERRKLRHHGHLTGWTDRAPTEGLDPTPDTAEEPSDPKKTISRLAFAAIGAAMVLTSLNFSISFVAFSEIANSFDAATTTVSWALTAFSITVGALIVPGGWAADRYGRARVFVVGMAVFLTGSALVAIAPTVELLIAARVLQAAGIALESPAMLALMLDAFGPERRATAVGITGGLGGIAAASGPAIGGLLVEQVGWRWTFAANLPIGILVVLALLMFLDFDHHSADRQLPDLFGAVLIIGSVGGLILGIVQSDTWGYFDLRTLAALAAAVTLGRLLVNRSRERASPIINLNLFSIGSFRSGAVLQLLVAGSFGGVFLTELAFLTDAWDYSLLQAGVIIAAIPAVAGPLTVVSGRWADRYGHRRVLVPGMITMVAAGLLLATAVGSEPALWTVWIPINIVYAIGVGLAHTACQALAVSEVPEQQLAMGGAMSRISQEVGSALTAAVAITLLARADTAVAGLRSAMTMLVLLTVVALPSALRLSQRSTVLSNDRSSAPSRT